MSDLYWLTDEQMARLSPYFPKSHGKPRVDDRRVLSGIIFVNRNGLRWRDAPREYGPHKTLYNRWKRWGGIVEGAQLHSMMMRVRIPGDAVVAEVVACVCLGQMMCGSGLSEVMLGLIDNLGACDAWEMA